MKKIKYLLQMYDGLWSVPFAFLLFWLIGLILQYFDITSGSYDIAFVQPLFLAIAVVIGATNAAVMGLYFTFRGLFRFLYGKKVNGTIINDSKTEFKNLKAWQKFTFSLLVFFFYLYMVVSVYLKLV